MRLVRIMRPLFCLAALAIGPARLPAAEPAARPPNFVFIYADDLGYGDLGCYGNTEIKTPNLDRMAGEGLRFTQLYSCANVCTPSRAGLLTGRYPIRSGLTRVLFPKSQDGIEDGEVTLAKALKAKGYATAIVGKWHLGHLPQYLPTRHGFDSYFGIPYSNDMNPHPLLRGKAGEEVKTVDEKPDQTQLTRRYTEEAVQFIQTNKDKPFFLYLPHTMPHVPLFASDKFKGKSARGLFGDVIEELDWSVGEVLAALKKAGVDDQTLVVFSSDNGPWLIKGKDGGSAGPLRDGKGTNFEGGVREPCLARWPGKIKPGRVETAPASMLDWFPTFVKLAGADLPKDRTIDGKDISSVLQGAGKRDGAEFFYYAGNTLQAVRSGPWKLKLASDVKGKEHPELLFHLEDDPGEKTNLAEKNPDMVKKLKARMADWEKNLGPVPKTKT